MHIQLQLAHAHTTAADTCTYNCSWHMHIQLQLTHAHTCSWHMHTQLKLTHAHTTEADTCTYNCSWHMHTQLKLTHAHTTAADTCTHNCSWHMHTQLQLTHAHTTAADTCTHTGRQKRLQHQTFTTFCIKWRIANNCLYPHVREQQSLSRFQFPHFQQNTAGKSRSQNKTIQDAPRKGRNWTSGGLLPSALPRQGQAPLQPPVAVSRLSPLAGTALRHQLSLAPLKSPQSYWVCLCNQITVDWLLTLTAGPSF
jgi:hypothetical protein